MHSLQLLVVLYTPIRVCFLAEKWEFLWFYFNSDPKSILLFFYFLLLLIWFDFFKFTCKFCTSITHTKKCFCLHHKCASFPCSLLPLPGGWGEPAGLQWAACHGGAEEDRSPSQTEVVEEGCPSESHPAPGSSPAAPPTLSQLPRGQPLQTPQQDSRDRCFFGA